MKQPFYKSILAGVHQLSKLGREPVAKTLAMSLLIE
jgi:hypothetical protein